MFHSKRIWYLTVLVVLAGLARSAHSGEVNAVDHMNRLLPTKPNVTVDLGGGRSGIYITTAARAANSYVVEVKGIEFDHAKIVSLPELVLFTQKTILNCADANLTSGISLNVSGTRSWSVAKTDGVTTTTSASLTGSFGVRNVGSASMTLSWSQAINTSTTETEAFQDAVSRSYTETMSLAPKKAVNISLKAFQSGIEIPFRATVVVDGDLWGAPVGFPRASTLLSVAERTLPVTGSVRVTEVSDALVRTDDLPGGSGCEGRKGTLVVSDGPQAKFPSVGQSTYLQSDFTLLGEAARLGSSLEPLTVKSSDFAGPSIAPPDGTSFEILYTTETVKPAVACGFNDLGMPNAGIFTTEARQYRTYANGQLVAQWQESVETFKSCFTP